eukprot:jgi/Galph1/5542/GphlegSOOS_G4136.1
MPASPGRRFTRNSSGGRSGKRSISSEEKTTAQVVERSTSQGTPSNKKHKRVSHQKKLASAEERSFEDIPVPTNEDDKNVTNGKFQPIITGNRDEKKNSFSSNSQKPAMKLVIRPLSSAPKVSERFAQEVWTHYLREAVKAIHNATPVSFSYEELYRKVEDVCLQKMGSILFQNLQEEVEQHVSDQIQSLQGHSHEPQIFLSSMNRVWEDHCNQMKLIRSIFLFLDRSFVLHNAPVRSLWDMGLRIFRKHFQRVEEVERKTVQCIICLITAERNGESVPQDLLRDIVRMFCALEIYTESFEKPFLTASSDYYEAEGNTLLQQYDVYTYLKHVENRLSEEVNRVVSYLDRSTKSSLVQVTEKCLLEEHTTEILDKGFRSMMNENRQEDLTRLYRLLARVHQLDQLKKYLGMYTKTTGAQIIQDPEKDNQLVQLILDLKDKVDSIVHTSFEGNEPFQYAVKEAFESFVNMRQNKPAELIAKNWKGTLDKVLQFFRFIHGKDVFEAFYKKDLAKRLLLGKSASLDLEKTMISKLKAECGAGFTSKLEGMFKDIDLSQDIMKAFYESVEYYQCGSEVDLSVVVLTSSYWPQSPVGEVKLPKELAKLQDAFTRFYLNKYAGRKLTWTHNNSSCTLRANFPYGQKTISVSLYQTLVLLQFNESDSLSLKEINERVGLEMKELKRTLQSLACGKIRVLKKEPLSRDVEDEDINQIQVKETAEENQQTTERVVQDRQYQIDAAIVRIMKTRKTLTHSQLMSELYEQLKFPYQPADLKKRIESLIDREYLERDSENTQLYRIREMILMSLNALGKLMEEKRTFHLEKEQELRFEVSEECKVTLTLLEGTAELFGIELPKAHPLEFSDRKMAIFSWHGCELQLQGKTDLEYVASETPMHLYLKTHYILECKRLKCKESNVIGPRVVIVGPQDSGKSSLCQILASYALKGGRKILYATIDFQQGCFSIPGAIGASAVDHFSIQEGLVFENNLVYFYGHTGASENPKLLQRLVSNLSNSLEVRLENSDDIRWMGFILDSFGSLDGGNYDILKQALKEIKVDVIIVLGSERLYADIQRDFANDGRQIVQLPKSGGRSATKTSTSGTANSPLFLWLRGRSQSFHNFSSFDQIHIVRVGMGLHVPSTALPLGAESTLDPLQITQVAPSTELLHCILGVSQAKEEQKIVDSAVHGFVQVTKVDMNKRTLSLLAPSPGKLPGTYLIMGSIRWLE